MRHAAFIELLAQIKQLTPEQRKRLSVHLLGREPASAPCSLTPLLAVTGCPHCGASEDRLGSWGQSHGLKRYRCRDGGRTFNGLTGTALAHLRKREHWTRYAEILIEGVSLREAARHRGGVAGQRGLGTEQIPVLVVRDRSGQTADFKLEKLDAAHVMAVLRPRVDQEAILCSDSAGVYAAFARATGIAHRPLNIQQGPRVIEGVFHIQNVHAYDSRLKGGMRRFHGVATHYLENHLGGRRMLERYKTAITPKLCWAEAVGRPINS